MRFLYFILLVIIVSCQNKPESATVATDTKTKSFEMYELSEMAMLMELMYVDNERLKNKILNGDDLGEFPEQFMKIHKAAMTDPSEFDSFFKDQAVLFLKAQRLIYEDPSNAESHFDAMVNQCIACHQVKCSGPIPKIKKLYLNPVSE